MLIPLDDILNISPLLIVTESFKMPCNNMLPTSYVVPSTPQPKIDCVAVVLENTQMPMNQRYSLHKYFPFTLLSANEEENGKTCWGLNKIENTSLDEMFRWLPNPK